MKLRSLVGIGSTTFLFITIALFGLNFWHASKCAETQSSDEMTKYIASLQRRLLQAESQSLKNTLLLNKIINLVQHKLYHLETKELEELTKQSQDEAIRITLLLANHPAPPMPDFELDKKYQNNEHLADLVDDVFQKIDDNYYDKYGKDGDKSETGVTNIDGLDGLPLIDNKSDSALTDAEATTLCNQWKINYSVVTGVSWGNLPYDLQQKWIQYSCDYHLVEQGDLATASSSIPTGAR